MNWDKKVNKFLKDQLGINDWHEFYIPTAIAWVTSAVVGFVLWLILC